MHSSPRSLALSRLLLGLLLLVSCAAAETRAKPSLPRPPEGPCELTEASLAGIRELDAEFERELKAKRASEPVTRDYGFQFEDDPLGAIVNDGSCECLARRVSGDTLESCREVLHAAYTCLGGPGSERLMAHRNCVPHFATMAGRTIRVAISANGCLAPDSYFLVVTTIEEPTWSAVERALMSATP